MSFTIILIGLTVVLSFYAWNNQDKYYRWMMNPYQVERKKQYDRFLLSGFIHSDYVHLGFNMFTLYFFGSNLEDYYLRSIVGGDASYIFIALYLVAIVVSEIPTFLKHRNTPGYNSLGASGAVAAVIFSTIIFDPWNKIYVFFIPVPGILFGGLFLAYSWYQTKNARDNINHDAHFYGAVFGIIFTLILEPGLFGSFLNELF
ncbi:rhomboid family intramembrane serine protease [Marinigracilibium pacificum]|uniref:Rhomboid family intramembrane serine protease n=1 Tax=Marinigracilibium pacificum TaxID=2729599 RepID=A0A848J200_9BACT|nr:rhomboid family intramembrane serine protease [Marinigracilibium pacificum]NMM49751.1 rhomboid family intramembrane serine protease [Marinigracilibium pacificum]